MGQDRPINALLPGFAQVHVFNSTRIKPFIPGYMPIAMYLGVFAQNTPRSRVSACFHLPSTASIALHVLSKCQTRGRGTRENPLPILPVPLSSLPIYVDCRDQSSADGVRRAHQRPDPLDRKSVV